MIKLSQLFSTRIYEKVDVNDPQVSQALLSLKICKVPISVLHQGGDKGPVLVGSKVGTVVKLTDDPNEFTVAQRVKGRLLPGIVKVYSVHELIKGSVWAIVAERLQQPSDEERARMDSNFVMSFGFDDWASSSPEMAAIAKSAKKLGFEPDTHGGNIMKRRNGEFVLADLGPISLS